VIRLIHAELVKVRTTRLWFGLALGGLALTAVGTIALLAVANTAEGRLAGLQPVTTAEDVRRLLFDASGSMAFILVLAATMATAEFRYGTAVGTYLATPSRARVISAKSLAAAPVGFVFGVGAAALSLLLAAGWIAVKGDAMPFGSPVVIAVVQLGVQGAYGAVLALGFGALVRSQLVAILGLLGWLFVFEPLVTGLLPKTAKWAPFTGPGELFGRTADPSVVLFGRPGAAALAAAYIAIVWAAAVWAERRRDV
jgi:ABC-2 type transport system permease protein